MRFYRLGGLWQAWHGEISIQCSTWHWEF